MRNGTERIDAALIIIRVDKLNARICKLCYYSKTPYLGLLRSMELFIHRVPSLAYYNSSDPVFSRRVFVLFRPNERGQSVCAKVTANSIK